MFTRLNSSPALICYLVTHTVWLCPYQKTYVSNQASDVSRVLEWWKSGRRGGARRGEARRLEYVTTSWGLTCRQRELEFCLILLL